MPISVLQLRF